MSLQKKLEEVVGGSYPFHIIKKSCNPHNIEIDVDVIYYTTSLALRLGLRVLIEEEIRAVSGGEMIFRYVDNYKGSFKFAIQSNTGGDPKCTIIQTNELEKQFLDVLFREFNYINQRDTK